MATLIKQLVCHSTLTQHLGSGTVNYQHYTLTGGVSFLFIPPRDQRSDKESRREKVPDSKQWWYSAFWAPAIPRWGAELSWAGWGCRAELIPALQERKGTEEYLMSHLRTLRKEEVSSSLSSSLLSHFPALSFPTLISIVCLQISTATRASNSLSGL